MEATQASLHKGQVYLPCRGGRAGVRMSTREATRAQKVFCGLGTKPCLQDSFGERMYVNRASYLQQPSTEMNCLLVPVPVKRSFLTGEALSSIQKHGRQGWGGRTGSWCLTYPPLPPIIPEIRSPCPVSTSLWSRLEPTDHFSSVCLGERAVAREPPVRPHVPHSSAVSVLLMGAAVTTRDCSFSGCLPVVTGFQSTLKCIYLQKTTAPFNPP